MAKGIDGKKLPPGISQRQNGLFMGRVMYNGESRTLYNRNLTELKAKMLDLRYALEHGTYIKQNNITFDGWFREYVDVYKRNAVKQGTINNYEGHYNAYFKKPLGKMRLQDIRAEHIQKILNKMCADGYSDKTITLTYSVIFGAFKQALRNDLIAKNPVTLVSKPKGKPRKERVVFTKEQQRLYMQYAEKSYLCNLFQLAICTGMRGGELGGLLWSDVDFKNKIINITRTLLPSVGGGWRLDTPKTKSSKREIPMIGKAYDILKRQEKAYKESSGNVKKFNNDDFVFFCIRQTDQS